LPLLARAVIFDRMSEVTRILSAIEQGDPHAAEQLLPLVYEELRQLATQKLTQEKPGQTLQATALVHEAYLRLVDADRAPHWNSRGHFFAAAAEAMRRTLVENARARGADKRGGRWKRVELADWHNVAQPPEQVLALNEAIDRLVALAPEKAQLVTLRYFGGLSLPEAARAGGGWQRQELLDAELAVDSGGDDLFAVDEALTRLAAAHPRAARLVHLRLFLGQTLEEAAAHLGLQARTAYRDWAYARAWLRRELDRGT